jgi:hypothetical protein
LPPDPQSAPAPLQKGRRGGVEHLGELDDKGRRLRDKLDKDESQRQQHQRHEDRRHDGGDHAPVESAVLQDAVNGLLEQCGDEKGEQKRQKPGKNIRENHVQNPEYRDDKKHIEDERRLPPWDTAPPPFFTK